MKYMITVIKVLYRIPSVGIVLAAPITFLSFWALGVLIFLELEVEPSADLEFGNISELLLEPGNSSKLELDNGIAEYNVSSRNTQLYY